MHIYNYVRIHTVSRFHKILNQIMYINYNSVYIRIQILDSPEAASFFSGQILSFFVTTKKE